MQQLATVVFVALAWTLSPSALAGEKRVALVMGNGAYTHAPALTNPSNDAKAVAAALEKLGFQVTLAVDATQQEALRKLDAFTAALSGADAALLYYSGHGLQLGGSNYLLPIDLEATSERSVRYGAVDVAEIVRDLQENAATSFVVLDACRDNPFVQQLAAAAGTRSASASRGLARIKAAGNGTVIAYAAAAGEVASDGTDKHSPYTKAFLAHIGVPNVEIGLVFRRIAGEVVEKTGGAQRPEVLISLTREYYFAQQSTSAAPDQVQVEAKPNDGPAAPVAPPSVVAAAPPSAPDPIAKASRTLVPYAALLARLDLSEPAFVPPGAWKPPERDERTETEPNQSPASANPIAVNSVVKLRIDPIGDADWFYFTSGAAGVLNVASPSPPKDLDLAIRLLDAERRVVSDWKVAPRQGGHLDTGIDLPAPGAFWLEVRDGTNDATSQDAATLTLSLQPQEDRYEPNNLPSQARLVPPNGSRRINVFPVGDVDMLRFALDRPGDLTVRAFDVPPELEIAMQLLDADHAPVGGWALAPRPGGETHAVFSTRKPGMYILEIRDGGNDQRSARGFTLESNFTASVDAFEPNDGLATATQLSSDGEWPMAMFPTGDVDYIRLHVEQPGELRLAALGVPKNLDIAYRVLNADQRDLTGWIVAPRPGGDAVGSVDLSAGGSYTMEIRDGSNDQSSVEPFTLKAQFVRSPDNYQPNDSSALATPISPVVRCSSPYSHWQTQTGSS